MKVTNPKRRRSSKKRPMSSATMRRFLEAEGVRVTEIQPQKEPSYRFTMPIRSKDGGTNFISIRANDLGEIGLFLFLEGGVTVPKEDVFKALGLIRRLYRLKKGT